MMRITLNRVRQSLLPDLDNASEGKRKDPLPLFAPTLSVAIYIATTAKRARNVKISFHSINYFRFRRTGVCADTDRLCAE